MVAGVGESLESARGTLPLFLVNLRIFLGSKDGPRPRHFMSSHNGVKAKEVRTF